jgi:hypothetical protein
MELHFERINREERTSTLGTRARHSHIRNGNENAPYGIGGIGLRSVPSPRFFVVVCLHSDVILIRIAPCTVSRSLSESTCAAP